MRYVATINLVLNANDEASAQAAAEAILKELPVTDYQLVEVFDPTE